MLENQGGLPYENDRGAPCLTFFLFSILFVLPQNTKDRNTRLSLEKMNVVRKRKKKPKSYKHWAPSAYKNTITEVKIANLVSVRVSKVERQLLF